MHRAEAAPADQSQSSAAAAYASPFSPRSNKTNPAITPRRHARRESNIRPPPSPFGSLGLEFALQTKSIDSRSPRILATVPGEISAQQEYDQAESKEAPGSAPLSPNATLLLQSAKTVLSPSMRISPNARTRRMSVAAVAASRPTTGSTGEPLQLSVDGDDEGPLSPNSASAVYSPRNLDPSSTSHRLTARAYPNYLSEKPKLWSHSKAAAAAAAAAAIEREQNIERVERSRAATPTRSRRGSVSNLASVLALNDEAKSATQSRRGSQSNSSNTSPTRSRLHSRSPSVIPTASNKSPSRKMSISGGAVDELQVDQATASEDQLLALSDEKEEESKDATDSLQVVSTGRRRSSVIFGSGGSSRGSSSVRGRSRQGSRPSYQPSSRSPSHSREQSPAAQTITALQSPLAAATGLNERHRRNLSSSSITSSGSPIAAKRPSHFRSSSMVADGSTPTNTSSPKTPHRRAVTSMFSSEARASPTHASSNTAKLFSSGMSDQELMEMDAEYANLINLSPSMMRQARVAQRRHELEQRSKNEMIRMWEEQTNKEAQAERERRARMANRMNSTSYKRARFASGDVNYIASSGSDDDSNPTFMTEAAYNAQNEERAADLLFPFERMPYSTEGLNYRYQGNKIMNRKAMVAQRAKLSKHPAIREKIADYWRIFEFTAPVVPKDNNNKDDGSKGDNKDKKSKKSGEEKGARRNRNASMDSNSSETNNSNSNTTISRQQYLTLHLLMSKALHEVWTPKMGLALAESEWARDALAENPKLAAQVASQKNVSTNAEFVAQQAALQQLSLKDLKMAARKDLSTKDLMLLKSASTASITSTTSSASTATTSTTVAQPKTTVSRAAAAAAAALGPPSPLLAATLNRAGFIRAMWELVDLWTEGVEVEEYVNFLTLLLGRITKPNPAYIDPSNKKGNRKPPRPGPGSTINPNLHQSSLLYRDLSEVIRYKRPIHLPTGGYYKVLHIQKWWRYWWGLRRARMAKRIQRAWRKWLPYIQRRRYSREKAATRIQRFMRRRWARKRLLANPPVKLTSKPSVQRTMSNDSEISEGESIPAEVSSDEEIHSEAESQASADSEEADQRLTLREFREKLNHQQRVDEQTRDMQLLLWVCKKLQRFWRRICARKNENEKYQEKLAKKRAAILAGRDITLLREKKRELAANRRPSFNMALWQLLEDAHIQEPEMTEEQQAEAERRAKAEMELEHVRSLEADAQAARDLAEASKPFFPAGLIQMADEDELPGTPDLLPAGIGEIEDLGSLEILNSASGIISLSSTGGQADSNHQSSGPAVPKAPYSNFPILLSRPTIRLLKEYIERRNTKYPCNHLTAPSAIARFIYNIVTRIAKRHNHTHMELITKLSTLKHKLRKLEKEEASKGLAKLMKGFVDEQESSTTQPAATDNKSTEAKDGSTISAATATDSTASSLPIEENPAVTLAQVASHIEATEAIPLSSVDFLHGEFFYRALHELYPKLVHLIHACTDKYPFDWIPFRKPKTLSVEISASDAKTIIVEGEEGEEGTENQEPDLRRLQTAGGTRLNAEDLFQLNQLPGSGPTSAADRAKMKQLAAQKAKELTTKKKKSKDQLEAEQTAAGLKKKRKGKKKMRQDSREFEEMSDHGHSGIISATADLGSDEASQHEGESDESDSEEGEEETVVSSSSKGKKKGNKTLKPSRSQKKLHKSLGRIHESGKDGEDEDAPPELSAEEKTQLKAEKKAAKKAAAKAAKKARSEKLQAREERRRVRQVVRAKLKQQGMSADAIDAEVGEDTSSSEEVEPVKESESDKSNWGEGGSGDEESQSSDDEELEKLLNAAHSADQEADGHDSVATGEDEYEEQLIEEQITEEEAKVCTDAVVKRADGTFLRRKLVRMKKAQPEPEETAADSASVPTTPAGPSDASVVPIPTESTTSHVSDADKAEVSAYIASLKSRNTPTLEITAASKPTAPAVASSVKEDKTAKTGRRGSKKPGVASGTSRPGSQGGTATPVPPTNKPKGANQKKTVTKRSSTSEADKPVTPTSQMNPSVVDSAAVDPLLEQDVDAWKTGRDGGEIVGGINPEAMQVQHLDDLTDKLLRNQEAGYLNLAALNARKRRAAGLPLTQKELEAEAEEKAAGIEFVSKLNLPNTIKVQLLEGGAPVQFDLKRMLEEDAAEKAKSAGTSPKDADALPDEQPFQFTAEELLRKAQAALERRASMKLMEQNQQPLDRATALLGNTAGGLRLHGEDHAGGVSSLISPRTGKRISSHTSRRSTDGSTAFTTPRAPAPKSSNVPTSFPPWRAGGSTDVLQAKITYSLGDRADQQKKDRGEKKERINMHPAMIRQRRKERHEKAAERRAARMKALVEPTPEMLANTERSYRKDYDSSSGRRVTVKKPGTDGETVGPSTVTPILSSADEASDSEGTAGSMTDGATSRRRSMVNSRRSSISKQKSPRSTRKNSLTSSISGSEDNETLASLRRAVAQADAAAAAASGTDTGGVGGFVSGSASEGVESETERASRKIRKTARMSMTFAPPIVTGGELGPLLTINSSAANPLGNAQPFDYKGNSRRKQSQVNVPLASSDSESDLSFTSSNKRRSMIAGSDLNNSLSASSILQTDDSPSKQRPKLHTGLTHKNRASLVFQPPPGLSSTAADAAATTSETASLPVLSTPAKSIMAEPIVVTSTGLKPSRSRTELQIAAELPMEAPDVAPLPSTIAELPSPLLAAVTSAQRMKPAQVAVIVAPEQGMALVATSIKSPAKALVPESEPRVETPPSIVIVNAIAAAAPAAKPNSNRQVSHLDMREQAEMLDQMHAASGQPSNSDPAIPVAGAIYQKVLTQKSLLHRVTKQNTRFDSNPLADLLQVNQRTTIKPSMSVSPSKPALTAVVGGNEEVQASDSELVAPPVVQTRSTSSLQAAVESNASFVRRRSDSRSPVRALAVVPTPRPKPTPAKPVEPSKPPLPAASASAAELKHQTSASRLPLGTPDAWDEKSDNEFMNSSLHKVELQLPPLLPSSTLFVKAPPNASASVSTGPANKISGSQTARSLTTLTKQTAERIKQERLNKTQDDLQTIYARQQEKEAQRLAARMERERKRREAMRSTHGYKSNDSDTEYDEPQWRERSRERLLRLRKKESQQQMNAEVNKSGSSSQLLFPALPQAAHQTIRDPLTGQLFRVVADPEPGNEAGAGSTTTLLPRLVDSTNTNTTTPRNHRMFEISQNSRRRRMKTNRARGELDTNSESEIDLRQTHVKQLPLGSRNRIALYSESETEAEKSEPERVVFYRGGTVRQAPSGLAIQAAPASLALPVPPPSKHHQQMLPSFKTADNQTYVVAIEPEKIANLSIEKLLLPTLHQGKLHRGTNRRNRFRQQQDMQGSNHSNNSPSPVRGRNRKKKHNNPLGLLDYAREHEKRALRGSRSVVVRAAEARAKASLEASLANYATPGETAASLIMGAKKQRELDSLGNAVSMEQLLVMHAKRQQQEAKLHNPHSHIFDPTLPGDASAISTMGSKDQTPIASRSIASVRRGLVGFGNKTYATGLTSATETSEDDYGTDHEREAFPAYVKQPSVDRGAISNNAMSTSAFLLRATGLQRPKSAEEVKNNSAVTASVSSPKPGLKVNAETPIASPEAKVDSIAPVGQPVLTAVAAESSTMKEPTEA